MRRKRRTKYSWLPFLGEAIDVGDDSYYVNTIDFSVTVQSDGSPDLYITPVTTDFAQEEPGIEVPMGEIIGNEYFLKRAVGKLHISYTQEADGPASKPAAAVVTAGLFVARAGSRNENAGGPNYPIGYGTTVLDNFDNYSPMARATGREPWIWRRSWVLGNVAGALTNSNTGQNYFPRTTAEYGSVLDGPHIDAKTARRVGSDDRLFFACAARATVQGSNNPALDGAIHGTLDLRLLGALRKVRQKGTF